VIGCSYSTPGKDVDDGSAQSVLRHVEMWSPAVRGHEHDVDVEPRGPETRAECSENAAADVFETAARLLARDGPALGPVGSPEGTFA